MSPTQPDPTLTASPSVSAVSPEAAIETSGLTKRFGQRAAIDDVDLRVPRGSAFGFLGPNGAGKTTMIRTLLGLTRACAGSMTLLGYPVPAQRAQALARVGAIVEEPRFHAHLSAARTCASSRRCAMSRHSRESARRLSGLALQNGPTSGSRSTRWACASASAWRAACWPTRSC